MTEMLALSENASLTPFPRSDITVERKGKKLISQNQDHNSNSPFQTPSSEVLMTATSQRQTSGQHSPPVRDISAPLVVHDFMRNLEFQVPNTVAYLPQSGTNVTEMEKRIAFLEGKLSSLMADMNTNLKIQSDKAIELTLLKENLKDSQQKHVDSVIATDQISSHQLALEHKSLLDQLTEFKLKAQEQAENRYSLEERIQACQSLEVNLRQELNRLTQNLDKKQTDYDALQASMNATSRQLQFHEEAQQQHQIQYDQLIKETEALRAQTHWYQNQLHEAIHSRESLSKKYEEVNQHLLQAAVDKEQLNAENSNLKVALWDLKEKVIEGKKKLIEQLQEIEEGMQNKDHQLYTLENERSRLNYLLQEHKLQLEESKIQVDTAKLQTSGLQENIMQLQSELEARAIDLRQLQAEKLHLQSSIIEIQNEVAVRDSKLSEQLAEYNRQADELRKSSNHCDDLCSRLEALNLEKETLQINLSEHLRIKGELESQLYILQQKLTDSEITIRELTQGMVERTSQLGNLRVQNETLSREVEETKLQVSLKEQALTLLHQQFNELISVKAKLAEENTLLSSELTSVRVRFDEAELKVSNVLNSNMLLEEQRLQKEAALTTVNGELISVKEELFSVRNALQQYSDQCDKYHQRILELEHYQNEVISLQYNLQEAHSAKAFMEKQVETLQVAKHELEDSLERRVNEYETQVAHLRHNEETLQNEKQSLQTSHSIQMKEQAALHSDVLNKLSHQLNILEKEREELQRHGDVLNQRLTETNAQLHTNSVVYERRMQEIQQRCAAYEQYVEQCRLLEVNLHQAYGQISGLQDYVNMLKTNATAVEEKLTKRETELYRLKLDHDRRIHEMKNENDALSLQNGSSQAALESERQLKTSLQSSVENLQKQQTLLSQQLREKNNQLAMLQQTVDEKERLLSTWKSGHESMESRLDELKKQVIVEKQQRGSVLLEKHQVEIEKKHLEERYNHLYTQWENAKTSLTQEREAVMSLHARLETQKNLQQETVKKLTDALETKNCNELSLIEEIGRLKSHNGQLNREVQEMKFALQRLVDTHQHQNQHSQDNNSAQQMFQRMKELSSSNSMPVLSQYNGGHSALQKCIAGLRKEVEELQSQTQFAMNTFGSASSENQIDGGV